MPSSHTDNDIEYNESCIIRIRGLAWAVEKKDILNFLAKVNIVGGEEGVHLITVTHNKKRATREAFVICASQEDYKLAFTFDQTYMRHRFIKVYSAKQEDVDKIMSEQSAVENTDTVIRLRGLPWGATENDVKYFFRGLEYDKKNGIYIPIHRNGGASGEAYVQFKTPDECAKALKRNMEKIGHRYIELFRSSPTELRRRMTADKKITLEIGKRSSSFESSRRSRSFERRRRRRRRRRYDDSVERRNSSSRSSRKKSRGREDYGRENDSGSYRRGSDRGEDRSRSRPYIDPLSHDNDDRNVSRSASGGNNVLYDDLYANGMETNNFVLMNNFRNGSDGTFGPISNGDEMNNFNGRMNNFINTNNNLNEIASKLFGFRNDPKSISEGDGGGDNFGNTKSIGFRTDVGEGIFGSVTRGNNFNTNRYRNDADNHFDSYHSGENIGGFNRGSNDLNRNRTRNDIGNRLDVNQIGGRCENNLNTNRKRNDVENNFISNLNRNDVGNRTNRLFNDNYCIHLSGMPLYCDEIDIVHFFEPIKLVHCKVIHNTEGLHTGTADAYFDSHQDAVMAMTKDRAKMGTRYIELFYNPLHNQQRRF